MNLQSRLREEPEVNLTSLIDVVLLLLVFFMVSTSFVREVEISLRLPQVDKGAESVISGKVLEIAITAAGSYIVNGRPLLNNEKSTLQAAIERLGIEISEGSVFIRADAEVKHQFVVTAMDVVGQLGFGEINITTAILPEV